MAIFNPYKSDNLTDEIAFRAENRQHRQNEAQGRADVFDAAKKFKNQGVQLDETQMNKFEAYFQNMENILAEKKRTSEIIDRMDAMNNTLEVNTEVVRDLTFETKMSNLDKLNSSAVEQKKKSAKRPWRPYSSIF